MADSSLIETYQGGEVRKLGCLVPPADYKPMVTQVFGEVGKVHSIPIADWEPVDFSEFVLQVENQNGVGQCNWEATCQIARTGRAMVGLASKTYDPSKGYGKTNGGSDRGSLPEDALAFGMTYGLYDLVPGANRLDWRSPPTAEQVKSQPSNRINEAYWCPTGELVASAIQQGFLADVCVQWWDQDPVDPDGWLGVQGRGNAGGHAVAGIGLVNRRGRWGIKIVNSWSKQWGVSGFGVLPLERVDAGCRIFRTYAVRGMVHDVPVAPPLKETA